MTFVTQAEARAEALMLARGDLDLFEEIPVYERNMNLRGPKGEPWHKLRSVDQNGNLIDILHHNNGHQFLDSGEFEFPHYHGPGGIHISYGVSN